MDGNVILVKCYPIFPADPVDPLRHANLKPTFSSSSSFCRLRLTLVHL